MRKKRFIILGLVVLSVLLIFRFVSQNFTSPETRAEQISKADYEGHVADFERISVSEASSIFKEDGILYIGRYNCPYCQILVPKLSKISRKMGKKIYYLDTIKEDEAIKKFRKKYGARYVPTVLRFYNEGTEVKKYNDTIQSLSDFLQNEPFVQINDLSSIDISETVEDFQEKSESQKLKEIMDVHNLILVSNSDIISVINNNINEGISRTDFEDTLTSYVNPAIQNNKKSINYLTKIVNETQSNHKEEYLEFINECYAFTNKYLESAKELVYEKSGSTIQELDKKLKSDYLFSVKMSRIESKKLMLLNAEVFSEKEFKALYENSLVKLVKLIQSKEVSKYVN